MVNFCGRWVIKDCSTPIFFKSMHIDWKPLQIDWKPLDLEWENIEWNRTEHYKKGF